MNKRNVVPALVFCGLSVLVAVALLIPAGATSVRHEIGTMLRWIANLTLTVSIVVIFMVAPLFIAWYVERLISYMLRETGSSWYWHWGFALAIAALFLVGWPYLVQWVVQIPADWTSRFFYMAAKNVPKSYGYMVYETPPIWWGVAAAIEAVCSYLTRWLW